MAKKNSTCPLCHAGYTMGSSGTVSGTVNGCDKCLGIVRDSNGYIWHPGEKNKYFQEVSTGAVIRVTRRAALNPKPKHG